MILARSAPMAVIFRRGPSKWVESIKWNTHTDTVEYGQWFKGRIYERRCDLSPDGTLLIYFASKINAHTVKDQEYTYAWTAISKPPWLTALALWPKGDCWQGGGLFEDDKTVLLNHKPQYASPHPKHVPQGLVVCANPQAQGEDDPIYSSRLTRDGWKVQQEWQVRYEYGKGGFITDSPEIRMRRHSTRPLRLSLTRTLSRLVYKELFVLETDAGQPVLDLRNADWADWDHSGRLVFLMSGKLIVGTFDETNQIVCRELADFNSQRPEAKVAPDWAARW
jgi:hypothetical protein